MSSRHDTITCPECRRETRIWDGNLDALPTDFRINSLLDVLAIKQCDTTEAKCGNCDKKSSHSFYCFQCCVFWCEDCIVHHNGLTANKKHRVLALKDFQEEDFADILKRPVFCQKQGHEKRNWSFIASAVKSRSVVLVSQPLTRVMQRYSWKKLRKNVSCK